NALNAFYRIVAVSAGGVRSLPSPTLSVQITNAAPVPPPPTLLSPIGGATVTLPFTLDWTDTANPQVAGYGVDIDNEPNFLGSVRSAYGLGWQDNSLGLWPILWGVALDHESVVRGGSVLGTVTLLNPAPPGGVVVTLVNNDSDLITLPPNVFIPAGGTGATFNVLTSPVSVPTRVTMDSGTAFEGYHAPATWLNLLPAGSATPPASLSSLTLASAGILGEGTTTGTVTLTSPAPAGTGLVRLS